MAYPLLCEIEPECWSLIPVPPDMTKGRIGDEVFWVAYQEQILAAVVKTADGKAAGNAKVIASAPLLLDALWDLFDVCLTQLSAEEQIKLCRDQRYVKAAELLAEVEGHA